jgi:hypothetical protein
MTFVARFRDVSAWITGQGIGYPELFVGFLSLSRRTTPQISRGIFFTDISISSIIGRSVISGYGQCRKTKHQ